jgi:hypothetical protein
LQLQPYDAKKTFFLSCLCMFVLFFARFCQSLF